MKKLAEWPPHVVYGAAIVIVGVLLTTTLTGFKVYDSVMQGRVDEQRKGCLAKVSERATAYEELNGKNEGDTVRMPMSDHKFLAEQIRNESDLCVKLYPPR